MLPVASGAYQRALRRHSGGSSSSEKWGQVKTNTWIRKSGELRAQEEERAREWQPRRCAVLRCGVWVLKEGQLGLKGAKILKSNKSKAGKIFWFSLSRLLLLLKCSKLELAELWSYKKIPGSCTLAEIYEIA